MHCINSFTITCTALKSLNSFTIQMSLPVLLFYAKLTKPGAQLAIVFCLIDPSLPHGLIKRKKENKPLTSARSN